MSAHLPAQDEPISALRPFQAARLVVVDIDGTLIVQPDEELFEQLTWLVGRLAHHSAAVACTVATGRAWAGAAPYVGALVRATGTPVILYNGAVTLTRGGDVLHARRMPAAAAHAVAVAAAAAGCGALAYDCTTGFWDQSPRESAVGWFRGPAPAREFNGLPVQPLSPAEPPPFDPVAMLVLAPAGAAQRAVSAAARATGAVTVTSSSSRYVEIRPLSADKGDALARLAERLALPIASIVAVGDNDNDAELLRAAGVGVAVNNASPVALAAADYVCRRPAAEGVVELFRLLLDAKRYARAAPVAAEDLTGR